MNFFRLLKYLYSKRLLGEIILFLQLTAMIVFAFSVLNPIDTYLEKRNALSQTYRPELSQFLHFSAGYELQQQDMTGKQDISVDIVSNILDETPGIEAVMEFTRTGVSYATGRVVSDGEHEHAVMTNAELIVYGKEYSEFFDLKLSEGKISIGTGEVIPVVVSSSLSSEFPVGSTREFQYSDGSTVACEVTGVLKENAALPAALSYGSFPSINVLGLFPWLDDGRDYIIALDNENIDVTWSYSCLIKPENGIDTEKLKDALNGKLGTLGSVEEVSEVLDRSFEVMLSTNGWYLLLFVLLALIAVFGYGGYLYLMICQKKRELGIFYLLGITRRKMAAMFFFTGFSILAAAFIASIFIAPPFISDILHIEQVSSGVFSYVFCALLPAAVLCISILAGFREVNKAEPINIYKGAD